MQSQDSGIVFSESLYEDKSFLWQRNTESVSSRT